jgi:hypothetical protein
MSEKAIHYGVLIGALALGAFVFGRAGQHAPPRPSPPAQSLLGVVPRDAALELTCDFARLRGSELGAQVTQRLGRIGGGDLVQRCGFDPLATIDQLALAIPVAADMEAESQGDFALVAAGHFRAQAIAGCAEQLIRDRGGEPTRSSLGSLLSVRDRHGAGGEVAVRDDGPLIVSGGAYFRELVDLANTQASAGANETRNPQHAALRKRLGDGTLLVTWLVPPDWFGRVADDERAKVSALSAVRSLGARLDLASDVRVSVQLGTTDEHAAEDVLALLTRLKQSAASLLLDPLLTGLASRVALSRQQERVALELTLSIAEAQSLLARAGELLERTPG